MLPVCLLVYFAHVDFRPTSLPLGVWGWLWLVNKTLTPPAFLFTVDVLRLICLFQGDNPMQIRVVLTSQHGQ